MELLAGDFIGAGTAVVAEATENKLCGAVLAWFEFELDSVVFEDVFELVLGGEMVFESLGGDSLYLGGNVAFCGVEEGREIPGQARDDGKVRGPQ